MSLSTLPTTEVLSRTIGQEEGKRFLVQVDDHNIASLLVLGSRVHVYLGSDDSPVAVLRFGSPYSGAMWVKNDLVGEFRKEHAGAYLVIEIEDGYKKPVPLENADPIQYLIDQVLESVDSQI